MSLRTAAIDAYRRDQVGVIPEEEQVFTRGAMRERVLGILSEAFGECFEVYRFFGGTLTGEAFVNVDGLMFNVSLPTAEREASIQLLLLHPHEPVEVSNLVELGRAIEMKEALEIKP